VILQKNVALIALQQGVADRNHSPF
jgi:hypothetical protein